MTETIQICLADSERFARLSGDFNPLHVDLVAARRLQFGSTVVHGIHVVLAALNAAMAAGHGAQRLRHLKARFDRPVRTGQPVELEFSKPDESVSESLINCTVLVARRIVQTIEFELENADSGPASGDCQWGAANPREPVERTPGELAGLTETLPLYWDLTIARALFPNLVRRFDAAPLTMILATTQVVGMASPGLHSVYTELQMSFDPAGRLTTGEFDYQVTRVDERFNRVEMTIDHPVAVAQIEAFFRPKPIRQADFKSILALPGLPGLNGRCALIVGGSRGLGEVTAKLFAAGGGRVRIAYAKGHDDAQRVCDEISAAGGQAESIAIDVLTECEQWYAKLAETPISDLFFFASPVIEKGDAFLWDPALFDRFCRFYLSGMANILGPFLRDKTARKRGLRLVLPSTVFIDDTPDGFAEYAAAKAAAETFARQVGRKYKKWQVECPRLPRLLTDQTAGVMEQTPLAAAAELANRLFAIGSDDSVVREGGW